jgi:hypothetical protein
MSALEPKQVLYQYQQTVYETVEDFDGTYVVPAKDQLVTLKNGKRYKVNAVNKTIGARSQIPAYQVFVEELK